MALRYFSLFIRELIDCITLLEKLLLGLQDAVVKGFEEVPIRYIICDDSGSMSESDGNMLVKSFGGIYEMVQSTRSIHTTNSLCFTYIV